MRVSFFRMALCVMLSACGFMLLAACGNNGPLSEIVVVISTDLTIPAQIDQITSIAQDVDGVRYETNARLIGSAAVTTPVSFGVSTLKGSGPVTITVRGLRAGNLVIERIVNTDFYEGAHVVLPIALEMTCYGHPCESNQTCIAGACQDPFVAVEDLAPYEE